MTPIKKLRTWRAVGYYLCFYAIPTNTNGKMTHKVYVEILENNVKYWIERGDNFVLEEDCDAAPGIGEEKKKVLSESGRRRTTLNATLI
jgi:hypothetical protein